MIVDDSKTICRITTEILSKFGFSPDVAYDGRQALEKCLSVMPDFIFLDWNMPVMNGLEFLSELRAAENGADPLVIFCTTENDFEHIQAALAAGANEYIMKPFDADIIKSKLQQLGILDMEWME